MKPSNEPVFTAGNRSFKWGDALFETMRVKDSQLLLATFHFERLLSGLRLLNIPVSFSSGQLLSDIGRLCIANGCSASARVRLQVYRTENGSDYFIEAVSLTTPRWNENGLRIDVYPPVQKSCDVFAQLKSANYLPYILAGRYAEAERLDDAIILNSHGNLCDTSRANIFLVMGNHIITPSLDQGCIAGVMRRLVIETCSALPYQIQEQPVTLQMLMDADEVFLTNAIRGLQWVETFKKHRYHHAITRRLHEELAANQTGLDLL